MLAVVKWNMTLKQQRVFYFENWQSNYAVPDLPTLKKFYEYNLNLKLDFSDPASQNLVTQTELKVLCRYPSMQYFPW